MTECIEKLTRGRPFCLAHIDSIHMYPYAGGIARKVVYNWHNIESEAMLRYSETVPSPLRRWYAAETGRKLKRLERQILPEAFGHVVCSERERCKLLRIAPQARIAVVENGVDCSYFSGPPEAVPDSLVFVALMENVANALAASNFARNIWPRIRHRFPNLRLVLVGAQPLESVRQLASLPGVEVTGTVPDVRPYYSRTLAAIVPLLSGSGTRLKILEAMAARVPVISTPVGAEGLDAVPDQHLLIAEAADSEVWVRHVSLLLESRTERERLTAAAFEFVRSSYDWEMIDLKMKSIYEGWLKA